MCSYRPLDSKHLLSAIRLDMNSNEFHLAEEIDEDLLLDLCKNLLIIDSQRHIWRFSHLSVTEYFEQNHWTLEQAHCYVARVCLLLLLENYRMPEHKVDPTSRLWRDSHEALRSVKDLYRGFYGWNNKPGSWPPLLEYSHYYWPDHVCTLEGRKTDSLLSSILKCFLGSPMESSVQ
jgi:hypothetical protein